MTQITAQNIHTVTLLQITVTQINATEIHTVTLIQIAANNNDTTYCTEHKYSYTTTNSSK